MTKETNVETAANEQDAKSAASTIALAAKQLMVGKAKQEDANAVIANGEAHLVVAFTDSELASKKWTLDISGKDSDDIHETHTWEGIQGFHERESQPIMLNGQGKISTVARSGYTAGFFNTFYNIPKGSEDFTASQRSALWTKTKRAVSMALKILEQGMTARLVDGNIVLDGGEDNEMNVKARNAKSLNQIRKAFGLTESGTSPKTQTEENGHQSVVDLLEKANPSDLTSAVAKLCRATIRGEEALCPATIENLQAIAKMVTGNVAAFSTD